jgi:hypothetical protein
LSAEEVKRVMGYSLLKTNGYTTNNYLYQNAYLWNNSLTNAADNSYLLNSETAKIQGLLNSIHNKGVFLVHLVFRTLDNTVASQLLSVINSTGDLLRIYTDAGKVYFSVGANIVSATVLNDTWLVLDFGCVIKNNDLYLYIYVNGVLNGSGTFVGSYANIFNNVASSGLVYSIGRYTDVNDASPCYIQDFRIYVNKMIESDFNRLGGGLLTYSSGDNAVEVYDRIYNVISVGANENYALYPVKTEDITYTPYTHLNIHMKNNMLDINDKLYASGNSNFYIDKIYEDGLNASIQDIRIYSGYGLQSSNVPRNTQNGEEYLENVSIDMISWAAEQASYGNSNIFDVYNYAFDGATVFGSSSMIFGSSNNTLTTTSEGSRYGTYVSLPYGMNFGASNTSVSFWFRADRTYSNMEYYQSSNLSIGNSRISSSASAHSINKNAYTCTNFTNMYISGLNNYYQLGDGTNGSRTGFVASWSVDYSLNGLVGVPISKVFLSYDSSLGHIYMMEDGALYFLGRNDQGLFGMPTIVTIPSMIRRFWDAGDRIADISMNGGCIYFLTVGGKLYACGSNQYNNILETGVGNVVNVVIHPVLISNVWWGGEPISSIGAFGGGLVLSIGSVVIAKGLVNGTTYTNWNLLHTIANVVKIWTPASGRIYYMDKDGVYYYNGVRIQVLNNEKIVMLSCSGSIAVILTESGNVYTSATNVFSTTVVAAWGTDKLVRVSVGSYSSDVYYVYLTASGKVYVSGNSSWGQLNIGGTVSMPTLMPLVSSTNRAKVVEVYATNLGNIMGLTSTSESYTEFDGNRGEFIKYDAAGFSINAIGIGIYISTPYTVTLHKYSVNIKVYASDNEDVMLNRYVPWTKLGEDNIVLSYSANRQLVNIVFANKKKYRYYAALVYCNYNIDVSDFFVVSQPKFYMTIMDANVDADKRVCISVEGSIMKCVVKNGVSEKSLQYDVALAGSSITVFNHYVFAFDKSNRICKLYVNGVNVASESKMPVVADRGYMNNYIGRLHYPSEITGTYDYLSGNLSDFKIYYGLLTPNDVLVLMRSNKINNQIGVSAASSSSSIFAVETTGQYYLYNNNQQYNYYLANIMHGYGVIMRFFFRTSNNINAPLFYIGNLGSREVQISIVNGCLYLIMGSYIVTTKRVVSEDVWYAFELYTNIINTGMMNISVYLNSMPAFITVNNLGYALLHSVVYDGSMEPLNDMTSFIGAYNPRVNYNELGQYENGLVFTNTYYGNIVSSNIYNAGQMTSNINMGGILRYSSNINSFVGGYDVREVVGAAEMITELNGSVYFEEGYYNFAINTEYEIDCDMQIGFDNSLLNVAQRYSDSVCLSTDKPMYLNGYYKLNSRSVRNYADSSNMYLNLLYYKRAVGSYNNDYYTIVSPFVSYVAASNIADIGLYVPIETSRLYVSKGMVYDKVVYDKNFYIDMNAGADMKVLIQDFRIYNNSDNFSSNVANGFGASGYYYNLTYDKYDEIIDVNRWQKTKDYYLHNNGVVNRGVYYNEGNVGIGTSSTNASLDIYTKSSGVYSIKTNNPVWVNNGVVASSDMRIKKDVRDIDDGEALRKLMLIEPKIYEYIDKNRGKQDVYGFIAQQVGEVIPEAVKTDKEFIPNIYSICLVGGNLLLFPEGVDIYSKAVAGDILQIIYENGTRDTVKVNEIINKSTIIVDKEIGCDKVFVYGKEVDDFHILDKNYIYTLNVCATQDLSRQLVEENELIEMQEKLICELEKRL